MTGYVISAEYGALVEGWQNTDAALRMAIQAGDVEATRELVAEARDWREVMRACPMFVQGEGRAEPSSYLDDPYALAGFDHG